MPAVSKKQQRFFGMVRAAQKGEMENPSPEVAKAAATTKRSDVKKFANTKHKGLPEKKMNTNESAVPGKPAEKLKTDRNMFSVSDEEKKAARERLLAKTKAKRAKLKEEKKKGLWDNIHAKRKRGEKPAKPGDKNYPETLKVEGYYDPMEDPTFDHDEAERTRGQSGKNKSTTVKKKPKKTTKEEVENIAERGDFWHPDPDKDRKLGGPGANQRARDDRGAKAGTRGTSSNDKKLRPGESYMQYAKRMKNRKEEVEFTEGTATDVAIKAIEKTKPPYLSKRSEIIRKLKQRQLSKYLKQRDKKKVQANEGAAWTKKAGKSQSGGLNEKGRKSYERENPGSDLKAPSKKVGNPRRASFCARMSGMKKKLTSKKTANDPNSRINKSLRAWNC